MHPNFTNCTFQIPQKSGEIYSFLSEAAPYGDVMDTAVDSVIAKIHNRTNVAQKSLKVRQLRIEPLASSYIYDPQPKKDQSWYYGNDFCLSVHPFSRLTGHLPACPFVRQCLSHPI